MDTNLMIGCRPNQKSPTKGRRRWLLRTMNPVRLNALCGFSRKMSRGRTVATTTSVVALAATLKVVKQGGTVYELIGSKAA